MEWTHPQESWALTLMLSWRFRLSGYYAFQRLHLGSTRLIFGNRVDSEVAGSSGNGARDSNEDLRKICQGL